MIFPSLNPSYLEGVIQESAQLSEQAYNSICMYEHHIKNKSKK